MKKILHKSVAFLLSVVLTAGIAVTPLYAAEEDVSLKAATYEGDILAAVNTSESSGGSFSASEKTEKGETVEEPEASGETEGVWDYYVEPTTGETYYKIEPELPEITKTAKANASPKAAANYQVGTTMKVDSYYDGMITFECLYVGTHCTVWCSNSDYSGINQISSEIAAEIGGEFDGKYAVISHAFGTSWNDKDSDGKVAILCYDIKGSYDRHETGSPYVAGYFFSGDDIDCINVDTYPGMGLSFSNVQESYSTLFHEYQHMLNDYYDDQTTWSKQMPSYLNEAFSMASEHLVCGSDCTASRVDWFSGKVADSSGKRYTPGTSLFSWGGGLDNYAVSYLFGQYLRTRYAQMGENGDGSGIYSAIQTKRISESKYAEDVIEELLNTTMKALLVDFWQAVALRETSGVHGFNGEMWAFSIDISNQTGTLSGANSVGAGGVKYYTLSGSFTPKSQTNITFAAMREPEIPDASDAAADRTEENTILFSLTPSCGGLVNYAIGDTVISDAGLLEKTAVLKTGEVFRGSFAESEDRDCVISYQFVSTTGKTGKIRSIEIASTKLKVSWSCGADGTVSGELNIPGLEKTDFSMKLAAGTGNTGSLLLAFYEKGSGRMLGIRKAEISEETGELKSAVGDLNPENCTVKLLLANGSFSPSDSCLTLNS